MCSVTFFLLGLFAWQQRTILLFGALYLKECCRKSREIFQLHRIAELQRAVSLELCLPRLNKEGYYFDKPPYSSY